MCIIYVYVLLIHQEFMYNYPTSVIKLLLPRKHIASSHIEGRCLIPLADMLCAILLTRS